MGGCTRPLPRDAVHVFTSAVISQTKSSRDVAFENVNLSPVPDRDLLRAIRPCLGPDAQPGAHKLNNRRETARDRQSGSKGTISRPCSLPRVSRTSRDQGTSRFLKDLWRRRSSRSSSSLDSAGSPRKTRVRSSDRMRASIDWRTSQPAAGRATTTQPSRRVPLDGNDRLV